MNYYWMSLYVILYIVSLNTDFNISFTFFFMEIYKDYLWILSSLQEFYQ